MYFEKSLRFVFKLSLVFGCVLILEKFIIKDSNNLRKHLSLSKDLLLGLKANRSLSSDYNIQGFNETAYFMN